MEIADTRRGIEAILLVGQEPVPVTRLAEVLAVTVGEVGEILGELAAHYADRGIRLREVAGGWEFCTAPEAAASVQKFLALPPRDYLTRTALEILAIIAYRQPITRAQIEAIRGVRTDKPLSSLMEKGLVKPVGKAETLGRPFLYGTTEEFLRYFGLNSLVDLPPLPPVDGQRALPAHQGDLFSATSPEETAPVGEETLPAADEA